MFQLDRETIVRNETAEFGIVKGTLRRCLPYSDDVRVPDGVHTIGYDVFSPDKGSSGSTELWGSPEADMTRPMFRDQVTSGEFRPSAAGSQPVGPVYSRLRSVVLPEGVKEILAYAFSKCYDLERIDLPEGIEKIRNGAFNGCLKLREITLPKSLRLLGIDALRSTALERVTIPAGIRRIEDSTFMWCAQLREVSLPEGLESVGYQAFSGCTRLASIALPPSIRQIKNRAFFGCRALREVVIPAADVEISGSAFKNCEEIVIIAPRGSTAHEFAKENGIEFREIEEE